MTGEQPRARCPWCGQDRAVTKLGRLRKHERPRVPTPPREACAGSGQVPDTTSDHDRHHEEAQQWTSNG